MQRVRQVVLIGSVAAGSWMGMQAIHEFGHVLGAWLSGGRVSRVVLHPLTISRTDLLVNPHPLFVVWSGPVIGVIVPLLLWQAASAARVSWAFAARFFAGFCLLANGLYLACGSFDRVGDCGEMLRHGSELWHLWLFGIVTAPAGLFLWHRQSVNFGLGAGGRQIEGRVAYGCLTVCLVLLLIGLVTGAERPGV